MANIRSLVRRIEKLEDRHGRVLSHWAVETLIAFSESLSEREHAFYLLSMPDLYGLECKMLSLDDDGMYRRERGLAFLPDIPYTTDEDGQIVVNLSEDELAAILEKQRTILANLVERLSDVDEIFDVMVQPNSFCHHDLCKRWDDALEALLIAARDDAPDLEERKDDLRALAWRPQTVPSSEPWPIKREAKEPMKLDTGPSAQPDTADGRLAAKLAAIKGRGSGVQLFYTGLRAGMCSITLRPSRRVIYFSSRNPIALMSEAEARHLLKSPSGGEWEVIL